MKKQENLHSQETKQPLEDCPLDMTQVLELSNREFKRAAINMLKALVENLNMQDHMSNNFSRDLETIKKNQMEMLEINI